jgi:hypothetical protein
MSEAKQQYQRRQYAHYRRIRDGLRDLYDHMAGIMQLSDDWTAKEAVRCAFLETRDAVKDFFQHQLAVDVSPAGRDDLAERAPRPGHH